MLEPSEFALVWNLRGGTGCWCDTNIFDEASFDPHMNSSKSSRACFFPTGRGFLCMYYSVYNSIDTLSILPLHGLTFLFVCPTR